jgi:hypothetical protein
VRRKSREMGRRRKRVKMVAIRRKLRLRGSVEVWKKKRCSVST